MDHLRDVVRRVECVDFSQLAPLTIVRVRTHDSSYRFVVMEGSGVYVQGGELFPDAIPARFVAAWMGGGPVIDGWICQGFEMQLCAGGTCLKTSRVLAIATESARAAVLH